MRAGSFRRRLNLHQGLGYDHQVFDVLTGISK